MLGVRLGSMLEASPFGFETLSTHLVKCAVAASLAVSREERPDRRSVLATIGFQVCNKSTHPDIKKVWNELRQFRAVGSKCEKFEGVEDDTVFLSTRQLQVELMIQTKKNRIQETHRKRRERQKSRKQT